MQWIGLHDFLPSGGNWAFLNGVSAYIVTRIDIRNEASTRYTDVGLGMPTVPGVSDLNEISVYAWPAGPGEESAAAILGNMLDKARGVFTDFYLLEKYPVMLGDMPALRT